MAGASYRYQRLHRYLAALPPDQPELVLTVADLEQVLGPRHRPGLDLGPAWQLVDVARVVGRLVRDCTVYYDRPAQCVRLRRRAPAPPPAG